MSEESYENDLYEEILALREVVNDLRAQLKQRDERIAELEKALRHLYKKCLTYGGPKGGKMDLSEARTLLEVKS